MTDKLFSEEAETCVECVDRGFTIKDGRISDPGKFEGEPLVAYHAYHTMGDGFADDDDGPAWRVGNVTCEESEQGFVYAHIYPSDEEAMSEWDCRGADDSLQGGW